MGTIPLPHGRGSVWSRAVTTPLRSWLCLVVGSYHSLTVVALFGRGSVVVLYDLLFGRENVRKGTAQLLDCLAYLRRYRLAKLYLGGLNPYKIDIKLDILTDHIDK